MTAVGSKFVSGLMEAKDQGKKQVRVAEVDKLTICGNKSLLCNC
jgi:hypothetical protein